MTLSLFSLRTAVEGEALVALCIVGETKSEALGVAELALNYYEAPGPKAGISVRIDRDILLHRLRIDFGDSAGSVDIGDIGLSSISEFLEFVQESPGYGVFLAYGKNNPRFISPSTFCIIKQDIVIDGEFILLESRSDLWKLVKDSIPN